MPSPKPLYLQYPDYIPPHPKTHDTRSYERSIAFGLQMRGDNDEIPVLIYYGAPFQLLYDVMAYIGKCMGTMIKGYVINNEHSCRWKNGKAYRRVSVEIHGLNEQFISLPSLILIINNVMQRLCWCSIKELPLKRLLNL